MFETIRADFPILNQRVHGHPLVYLDNAATMQKPQCVIDAIVQYYRQDNANVHRGVHHLSERTTQAFEEVRQKVADFIHAAQAHEIIFTKGCTESINLVAQCYGQHIKAGDEILVSQLEHHSNLIPWQMLAAKTHAILKIIPIDANGDLIQDEYERLLSPRTKIVAVNHVSNALGTINPIGSMIKKAHLVGAVFLVDGAQAAGHMPIDVQALDCDFYTLTGHKMCGPTGVGVLYGKASLLSEMPAYQFGGGMIEQVSSHHATFQAAPMKFEAGTPNMEGVIGLGTALNYLTSKGLRNIAHYEHELLMYAKECVKQVPGFKVVGSPIHQAAVMSFLVGHAHPHDIGTILDSEGVAIRAGHHCAMPLMVQLGVSATARASFAFYNTRSDIDRFVAALLKVHEVL